MTDIRTIAQRALDTIDHNDIRVNDAVHHALNDLRQALASPEPSVDALIAEIAALETFSVSGGHGEPSSQAISVWKLKPILDKYRGVK